jgi:hypothetical protein
MWRKGGMQAASSRVIYKCDDDQQLYDSDSTTVVGTNETREFWNEKQVGRKK